MGVWLVRYKQIKFLLRNGHFLTIKDIHFRVQDTSACYDSLHVQLDRINVVELD